MRVLYVIDSLVPGGAETSLAAIAPSLVASGIDLRVAYLKGEGGSIGERLEAAGVKLYRVSGGRIARIAALRRVIAAVEPDLIHTTLFEADIAGRIAARLARKRVVSSLVNVAYGSIEHPPGVPRWKTQGARIADLATSQLVTRWQAISRSVADIMSKRLRVSPDRIEIIPRARSADALGTCTDERRSKTRSALGIEPGAPVVLAAARHEYQKGLDVLLRAFELVRVEVPEARLIVAGRTGNQTAALSELARGREDHVELLGLRDDIADLMCASDVFAFPSRWEGLGSVLLEAMSLKIPIVASDLPPVRETLPDGTALFSAVDDPSGLASNIINALQNPSAAKQRADAAHARVVSEYSIEDIAARTRRFYERALA